MSLALVEEKCAGVLLLAEILDVEVSEYGISNERPFIRIDTVNAKGGMLFEGPNGFFTYWEPANLGLEYVEDTDGTYRLII